MASSIMSSASASGIISGSICACGISISKKIKKRIIFPKNGETFLYKICMGTNFSLVRFYYVIYTSDFPQNFSCHPFPFRVTCKDLYKNLVANFKIYLSCSILHIKLVFHNRILVCQRSGLRLSKSSTVLIFRPAISS